MKKSRQNNKFKLSALTRNDKFELPDGSYSVSYPGDYFEYVIKKHERGTDNPSIRIYVNATENSITSEIKILLYYYIVSNF